MFLLPLVTCISVGGFFALLATGYSLIYSLLDFSNWAHGEFAMVSAYIAIVLSSFMGMPFVLAAVGGMAGGALVSFLCERFAYRRIRRNGAPNMFLMIAAMGLSNVFQQAANRSVPVLPLQAAGFHDQGGIRLHRRFGSGESGYYRRDHHHFGVSHQ